MEERAKAPGHFRLNRIWMTGSTLAAEAARAGMTELAVNMVEESRVLSRGHMFVCLLACLFVCFIHGSFPIKQAGFP